MRVETNPRGEFPLREVGRRAPSGMRRQSLAVDYSSLLSYAKGIPLMLDEAQRKYGLGVYEKMRRDAAVEGAFRKWKQEILSAELRIVPPTGFEDDTEVLKECAFMGRCFDRLDTRIEDIAWQMLDCGSDGHSLIEVTWKPGEGMDSGKDVLDSLRAIPPDLHMLVQDAYGRFLGAIGWVPGHVPIFWEGPILLPLESLPGFIPAWKFALMTHNAKIGGIAGRSRFESAYNPYSIKYKNWALMLQFLIRFAGPVPIGEVSKDAQSRDPNKTPEEEMGEFLATIEEMSGCGIPSGTNLKFLEVKGGETVFINTIKACNGEIATAILGNARSIQEAEHGSKNDSETAQDSVDEDTAYIGSQLCSVVNRQVIRPLVRSNRGPDFPCPVMVIGSDTDDFATTAGPASQLYAADAVADNQEAAIARKLGIPAPNVPFSKRKSASVVTIGPDGEPIPPKAKDDDSEESENDKKPNKKPKQTSFFQIPWSSRRAA